MEMTTTQRGFGLHEFEDRYGSKCSLQESSASGDEDTGAFIWFGVDKPEVKVFRPDDGGWQNVPLPEDVMISGRMHLSQVEVERLLPSLQYFANSGYLPTTEEHAKFVEHIKPANEIVASYFEEVSS